MKPGARGFTLLEIMVVVVIIGILDALVVPNIIGRPDEARQMAAKQDVATVMQALKLYRLDNLRYPTTEQGLQALVVKPTTEIVCRCNFRHAMRDQSSRLILTGSRISTRPGDVRTNDAARSSWRTRATTSRTDPTPLARSC